MTENKRYFERNWGEEYYIFDSQTISEKEFDEKVEYEDYRAFADSMTGDDVVNRLNENEQLKQRCKELRNDLINHSALIDMLETVKALGIEDMIWNTMGYKTQTEFDDDFVYYREKAKRRWRE